MRGCVYADRSISVRPGRAGVYTDRLIVWLGAVFYSADTDDRLSFMLVVYVVTKDHK